ncbi:uroporphyrinogen-III synthase isoform X1 [Betta splendens]|uniref:Uroporphyrinogen-III synthase n=1 Tax=Betta splendens TaxID=158456 RepID=A0A6P7LAS4_BETSP|nr:uroporphyrinogen-III synthase isoform X1 [Betta splendens]
MHVLLLKEPRDEESGPDPYVKELASYGHKATLIPVLSFKFVSLNTLSDKLFQADYYGGLIFTSPRAVEAVVKSLEADERKEEWDQSMRDKWNTKSIYVVGKATAALVKSLGLKTLGEDTGTAEILSRVIIEREDKKMSPLLFPCGSLKREVLPTALRDNGVPLETMTVYQTAEHPDLKKNLKNYFTEQGTPASIAFFSPSGVRFCLEVIQRLSVCCYRTYYTRRHGSRRPGCQLHCREAYGRTFGCSNSQSFARTIHRTQCLIPATLADVCEFRIKMFVNFCSFCQQRQVNVYRFVCTVCFTVFMSKCFFLNKFQQT